MADGNCFSPGDLSGPRLPRSSSACALRSRHHVWLTLISDLTIAASVRSRYMAMTERAEFMLGDVRGALRS